MKKQTITLILIACVLITAGMILCVGTMSMIHWDLNKLSTTKYETNSQEITDSFESIFMELSAADVELLPSEDNVCRVICQEQEKFRHEVTVQDGTLRIIEVDSREFLDHISVFSFGEAKVKVYLPAENYKDLSIHGSSGDIDIHEDFMFETIGIEIESGDVTSYASALDSMEIHTDTGDISLENVSADSMNLHVMTGMIEINSVVCAQKLQIEVTTGRSNITGVQCSDLISKGSTGEIIMENVIIKDLCSVDRSTGDVISRFCDAGEFNINTDTGNVKFEACDSDYIHIITNTGDVKGSFRSDKVFLVSTNTGNIDIPRTTSGSVCEIETDTGDIHITVE